MTPPKHRVALITGASRGIGRAVAIALAQRGWRIAVNYLRNEAAANETIAAIEAAGGHARALQADISIPADRARLLDETIAALGPIDLLVNNAGIAPRERRDLLEATEASFDEVLATNLKGPYFLTQAVARHMIEQGVQGKIVTIGSISAEAASVNRGEYCVSKAGLGMMTALFADRLAPHGILVYEVRPGIIATDMTAAVHETYDQRIADGLSPIRRWGTPDDVAAAVAALAEGALPFSTGEIIHVDGGLHLRRL